MLFIRLGVKDVYKKILPNFIWRTDSYFNNTFEPEWFDDELVKEMVLDIDKTVVLSHYCMDSPVLGQIPPEMLSQGVKTLILMLKQPDMIFYATNCGDNCAKWIIEISKRQDLHIVLGHYMQWGDSEIVLNGIIENCNLEFSTTSQLMDYYSEFSLVR